ncbi:hypothetical protein [Microbacterium cremeum]|uniref:hypothetical protein n=1 Tax=Microbacterium cremeum TaxID=2782169 RepID=UPI001E3E28F1|nr:hypothetical protein [Microbacterium cremeum]
MTSAESRTFAVRHVQLARAAFAALAALMITFSPDHSAAVGMAVFSGFAIASGLVLLLSVWLVYPAGRRWQAGALGGVTLVAGMVGGLGPMRTVTGFFVIVIAWALVSGALELLAGSLGLRGRTERREIAPGVADARPPAPVGRAPRAGTPPSPARSRCSSAWRCCSSSRRTPSTTPSKRRGRRSPSPG